MSRCENNKKIGHRKILDTSYMPSLHPIHFSSIDYRGVFGMSYINNKNKRNKEIL
jgi:hypothetical protein